MSQIVATKRALPGRLDPELVAGRLHAIEQDSGLLTAQSVVDDARMPDSLLHPIFEWRDDVAAEKYRVIQAEALIRVFVVREDDDSAPVRRWVNVRREMPGGGVARGYVSVHEAMGDEDLRAQVLADARREADAFRRKYGHLRELAEAIDGVMRALDEVQSRELQA